MLVNFAKPRRARDRALVAVSAPEGTLRSGDRNDIGLRGLSVRLRDIEIERDLRGEGEVSPKIVNISTKIIRRYENNSYLCIGIRG